MVIAIRDTDEKPYAKERRQLLWELLDGVPNIHSIIIIPDITAVVYGREPGYGLHQIRLPEELEAISGTKIRKERDEKAIRTT